MQKPTLLLMLALVSFGATRATSAQASPGGVLVRLGVVGGASAATFGRTDADFRRRVGALLGGYAVLRVSRRVDVQPELLYTMKGAREHLVVNSPAGPVPSVYTTHADYVELPVLARVSVAPPGRLTPYLLGGPAVALRAVCETAQAGVVELGRSTGCGDAVRRLDASVVVGAGLAIGGVGAGALDLGGRYDLGLVPIAPGASARNRVLSLTVGFEAPLRR